jgi:hypothetical protein
MNNEASQGAYYCDGCSTVPLSQLDLEPPLEGWKAALEARGGVILTDDIGRPAIVRSLARRSTGNVPGRGRDLKKNKLRKPRSATSPEARHCPCPRWHGPV